MGGSGVTTAMATQLVAFMDAAPIPDNPHRTTDLDAKALRGQQVFEQAQCNSCHEGQTFTNNTFADVGTFVSTGPAPDDLLRLADGLNTPSLLGVSRTAPYLHDGSAQTLEERLLRDRESNLHGETAALSDEDIDALVQYLKTL
jgi:mono/diheme cytochrome c family protein